MCSPDIVSSETTESWQHQELLRATCPVPLVASQQVLMAATKHTQTQDNTYINVERQWMLCLSAARLHLLLAMPIAAIHYVLYPVTWLPVDDALSEVFIGISIRNSFIHRSFIQSNLTGLLLRPFCRCLNGLLDFSRTNQFADSQFADKTIRGHAYSRTSRFADKPIRGQDDSRTGRFADNATYLK